MRKLLIFAAFILAAAGLGATGKILVHAQQPKEVKNSLGMELTLIPAGMFMMGSPKDEAQRNADETQHEITISKPFYLGVFEVTQGQYQKIMRQTPSFFAK